MSVKIPKILKFLVTLTIFAAPLYILRWEYFGILPTTLLELLIWITVMVWVVWKVKQRDFSLPRTRFDGPIVLLLVAATVAVFVSPNLRGALGVWKAYFIEPVVFYYLLIDVISNYTHGRERTLKWLRSGLVGAAVWLSLLGISQFLFNWPIITLHQIDRAHGVFNNGNALALFVGPILVWYTVRKLDRVALRRPKLRITDYGLPITVLLLTAVLMTKSLGAVIGLIAVIGAWLIVKQKRAIADQGLVILPIALFIGMVVFMTQVGRFTPVVENPWQRPAGTATVRLCVWEGVWNLIKDRPILGAGLSGFKELYSEKYFTCDAEPLEYPHNIFLNFWTETGILGLVAILWMLAKIFNFQFSSSNGKQEAYTLPFLYWLIHGMVDVPYFKNDLALLWFVFLAMVAINQEGEGVAVESFDVS